MITICDDIPQELSGFIVLPSLFRRFITLFSTVANEDNKKNLQSIRLILCENYFWCTSIISIKWDTVICPSCCGNALEVIPISSDESYPIDFTTNWGVRMNFRRRALPF